MELQQSVRKSLFSLSPEEARFSKRRFTPHDETSKAQLERVGGSFILGYNAAVRQSFPSSLTKTLEQVDSAFRGFAYEGAAMGLAMLDEILRWRRDRAKQFLEGPGKDHAYMVHVGIGIAWAQLRIRPRARLNKWDPVLGWLAVDGYGFHAGFFHWEKSIIGQRKPSHLDEEASRVFDQGLGRALWFVKGGSAQRVVETIRHFPKERQRDLWAGIGLASAYAGGVPSESLEHLRSESKEYFPDLCQGTVFAAAARVRAKNPATQTELACQSYLKMSQEEAEQLFLDKKKEGYEQWRKAIQDCFRSGT